MFSLKNKYVLGLISLIWVYLAYKANHLYSGNNYDWIPITLFIVGGWFTFLNHRMFVMTRKKLSTSFYWEQELEYKPFIRDNLVEKIFLRPIGTNDWYELDYTLTIPKNSPAHIYNDFVKKNGTVRRLLKTMNEAVDNSIVEKEYALLKSEYNGTRWLMLGVIIVCYLIYFMIKYANNNSLYY